MEIDREIKQKKFLNEYIKLDINIMFTASYLGCFKTEILRPYNISWQQFNILRILKGNHPNPASIKSLTGRMVDKTSNTSRLVDKLFQKNLVDRCVNPQDRRKADVFITSKGIDLIDKCSGVLESQLTEKISNLTEDEAATTNLLLNKLRD